MRTTLMIELAFVEGIEDDEPDYWFAEYYLNGDEWTTEHSGTGLGEVLLDVLASARPRTAMGTPIEWLDQCREPLSGELLELAKAAGVKLRDKV